MKEPKIYFMGKRIRSRKEKFNLLKIKIRNFFRKVLLISLIGLIFVGIFKLGGLLNIKEVIVYEKQEVILDNLTQKVNELKGQLLKDLKTCESQGYSEESGLITFDPHRTNKKVAPASIGLYQFKVDTVKHYYKTLYGKEITGKEAILIALDDEKASELASEVIFKTEKGLSNWINCTNKHNLKARLQVIKSLE